MNADPDSPENKEPAAGSVESWQTVTSEAVRRRKVKAVYNFHGAGGSCEKTRRRTLAVTEETFESLQ